MPIFEDDPKKVIALCVCIHISDWQTNIKPKKTPSILCPGFSGFKAVASICTALYQLRCSLGFYFLFHTSSSPLNPESWCFVLFLPGDFTVGNLKSLLWLYLYSCPLPKVTSLIVVSLYLPTNFPATNILLLKYGSFLSNSFCLKIQPGYSPVSHLSCDQGVDFLVLIQGLDLARQCFVASLFLLVGHVNHGPTEWRHGDWGPLITLNS